VSAVSVTVVTVNITGFARPSDRSDTALPPALDASQRAVLDLPVDASAAVLGAPGTGKTTTLIELIAHRVLEQGFSPDEVVALTSSRTSATRLRDAIAVRLGVATNGPLARTVNSLAHEIVGAAARSAGAPPPRLVTGGEQDADIAQLLEGHAEEGTGPDWPEMLGPDVRRLRGFRSELRELMMRATEYDVSPERLHSLGHQFERPEWNAAADFIREYRDVVANYRDDQLDSAELVEYAVTAVRGSDLSERVARLRLVVVDDSRSSPNPASPCCAPLPRGESRSSRSATPTWRPTRSGAASLIPSGVSPACSAPPAVRLWLTLWCSRRRTGTARCCAS
jgi:hypothetical protein